MFALPISMPRFKSIIFYPNSPKIKLFLKKKVQKFRVLGAPLSDPPIANFWLRARVIELLFGSKYNTAFNIPNLRCAYINTKTIITSPLN